MADNTQQHYHNHRHHPHGAPLPLLKRSSSSSSSSTTTSLNKGAWTAQEDAKLAQYIEIHGPRRWKSVAIKSGLNRCGKSCRLRWLNYLRPDIKRGNISEAEDDLILRLHRLLGNRWSLIARRLPGRTDNEIKNYWNAHLRKKAKLMEKLPATSTAALVKNWSEDDEFQDEEEEEEEEDDDDEDNDDDGEGECGKASSSMESGSSGNNNHEKMMMRTEANGGEGLLTTADEELFDFSRQGTCGLEWVKCFLELEEDDNDA